MIRRTHRARLRSLSVALLVFIVVSSGLATWATSPSAAHAESGDGTTTITGTLSLDMTGDPLTYVGLVDMTGFVRRDYTYPQGDRPIISTLNHETGAFQLDLPITPSGPMNNVGHRSDPNAGVQIYSVDLYWNILGDERITPLEGTGWSWWNTSLKTAHGTHEVVGGTIAVWAPDDAQRFPSDFGTDGKLFTDDDPIGPIRAGWTIVNLDESPFIQRREARVDVVVGPNEGTPVDLSQLPATAAFDQMIEILRGRYPFNPEIPIDWDGLRTQYRPEFEAAEQSGEQGDFWIALNHFLIALHHWAYFAVVPWDDYFAEQFLGSTGLHVEVTDQDQVIVVNVEPGQAAETAGMQTGAELVSWDGKPARQAVDDAIQMFTESSPQTALRQKLNNFGRLPVGTVVHVKFRNPGAADVNAIDLTAVEIPNEDIGRTGQCYRAWTPCDPLKPPVWLERLPSHIAVLHVAFFALDAQIERLIIDSWEAALRNLSYSDVAGLIIDLRPSDALDTPIVPIYLAGSFFDEPFPLADVTSVDAQGHDVTVGTLAVLPAPMQWDRPVALVVDEFCKGSCELFTLALTHRPDTIIAGMNPTGGSLSMTTESVLLPTGNFVLVMDQAFRDPTTHELLLEGKGIEPTLRVPKTAETLVQNVTTDVVRDAAEQALLAQINGTGIDPSATPVT